MAFPTDWGRKCPLVIQANKVDSNQSDFPVLLTKDTLPSEMFDADGSYPALDGGGDIRFSSDSDGSTRLACEIVTFTIDNNPANGKAEIWVKVPSISSSANTVIYIWYGKIDETQPVSNDTYGSENVWNSNFVGVWHMNQDPSGGSGCIKDSTSNANNGTPGGSMTPSDLVDGKIGKALDFDGSDDYINCGHSSSLDITSAITIETTINRGVTDVFHRLISKRGGTNGFDVYIGGATATNNDLTFDFYSNDNIQQSYGPDILQGWKHTVVTYDQTNVIFYVNGTADSHSQSGAIDSNALGDLFIGIFCDESSHPFEGINDEVRISNIARSPDWISACYNNQNDPSTFVIEGTPEYVVVYFFSGYTFEQNNPVSRKLYLHNRITGELITTTTSSGNGYYYMETISSGSHYIVCLDDVAGVEYNDLIIGPAFPTVVSG